MNWNAESLLNHIIHVYNIYAKFKNKEDECLQISFDFLSENEVRVICGQ